MRILATSDTHTYNDELLLMIDRVYKDESFDVFVHAGDFTNIGSIFDVERFNDMLGKIPAEHKIVIAGNHDWCLQTERWVAEGEITNATYLRDSSITIDGVKFYGSPWTPEFMDWAFNLSPAYLQDAWSIIPEDVDVLITHGPAKGILDYDLGCKYLFDRIQRLKNLKAHIFGHIHEGYGRTNIDGVEHLNAAFCSPAIRGIGYAPQNAPILLTL